MKLKQFLLINRLIDIKNIIEVPSDIVNDEEIMEEYHSIRQNMDNIEIEPINEDDSPKTWSNDIILTDEVWHSFKSMHKTIFSALVKTDALEEVVSRLIKISKLIDKNNEEKR